MHDDHEVIGHEKLTEIKAAMGPELYLAFDIMGSKLQIHHRNPREAAELREARNIIRHLRQPDHEHIVTRQQMAWALRHIVDVSEEMNLFQVVAVMYRTARLMNIDVAAPHPLPHELANQIDNAVRVMISHDASMLVAAS